jgi:transposase
MGYVLGREERWRELAISQLASGLNAKEFSKREKICLSSFYGWRKRLRLGANQGSRQVPGNPEPYQSGIA